MESAQAAAAPAGEVDTSPTDGFSTPSPQIGLKEPRRAQQLARVGAAHSAVPPSLLQLMPARLAPVPGRPCEKALAVVCFLLCVVIVELR